MYVQIVPPVNISKVHVFYYWLLLHSMEMVGFVDDHLDSFQVLTTANKAAL
jgi:hypothetical protein